MKLLSKIVKLNSVLLASGYVPPLNREALAGVWRLSGRKSIFPNFINESQLQQQQLENRQALPMKEFTIFSNKKSKLANTLCQGHDKGSNTLISSAKPEEPNTWYEHKDVYLKLCSDGSFEQYSSLSDSELEEEDEEDANSKKNDDKYDRDSIAKSFMESVDAGVNIEEAMKGLGENFDYSKYTDYKPPSPTSVAEKQKDDVYVVKGKWDYQDGKLILATNRPPNSDHRQVHDTVLVGRVIEEHDENEVFLNSTETSSSKVPTEATRRLAVPQGKVKIGKYFYPMNHPSFFERPIFQPTKAGSFELRQVLGEIESKDQTRGDDGWWKSRDYTEDYGEEFKKEQLMNRTYFVTSHPIGFEKKSKPRWSRSLKAFVVDRAPINDNDRISGIRVMELQLFANNTFSTIAGLGSSTVLRGKWAIVGDSRNYLWLQVWRFGFGRSVSGSTFRYVLDYRCFIANLFHDCPSLFFVHSEGRDLTKDDEKAYWGKIEEVEISNNDESKQDTESLEKRTRIEIKGTIFFGWGLEPEPVGRFTMLEKVDLDDEDEDEEDEDLIEITPDSAFE